MDHRSSDHTDVTVKVERKIPITWVLGGLVASGLMFGTWAWNISLTLNNVGRDVVQVKDDMKEVKAGQKDASIELNKGATRDNSADAKIDDLIHRVTRLETKIEAKK